MPTTTQSVPPRVIVIPRPLEGFFYERLSRQFAARSDVRVIVDRRAGSTAEERRVHKVVRPRRDDRRASGAAWSLADMPFAQT
jgi:hypothetical protein